ncbi:GNAT family N-acetyltransferase [Psychromarinibacter sp. S121]|uniref:GNAT family N-acetyltransferase n=1 Tax=Psychromarinibacter sp. S121 TaxID=3415127 RepID=UPI003C7ECC3D
MIHPHEFSPMGPAAGLADRMQSMVPVLGTDRLLLRAPRIDDFDLFAEIACSERAAGMGGPMSREAAWSEFMQMTGTWYLRGTGCWTVCNGGRAIGFAQIGFEPGDMEPELGFMFDAASEGHGFAYEAARAVMTHARETLGMTTLVSYVARDNARSISLALRLGGARDAAAEDLLPEPDRNDTNVYRYDLTGATA